MLSYSPPPRKFGHALLRVLIGLLLALPLSVLQVAGAAAAPCADPRGNAYCSGDGTVTFNSPTPSQPAPTPTLRPTPRPQPTTPPQSPSQVNAQNPNPPTNVNVQNPNPPTNVDMQNPNPPTNVDMQNPVGGDSGAQNPNAPIAGSATGQLAVTPSGGAAGDFVAVSGQGFGGNNLMFLNVIDSSGQVLDTDSRAFSCTETDDVLLNLYQDRGYGCSSGAQSGPLNKTGADGTFVGAIQIPSIAVPGPAQVCAQGVFATSCTTITISPAS